MKINEAVNLIKVALKDNQYRMDLKVEFSELEEAIRTIENELNLDNKVFCTEMDKRSIFEQLEEAYGGKNVHSEK